MAVLEKKQEHLINPYGGELVNLVKTGAEREALIYFTGFVVLIALVILISIQDIARLPGS